MERIRYKDNGGDRFPGCTEVLSNWQPGMNRLLAWAAGHGSKEAFRISRYRAADAGRQCHQWIAQTLGGASELSDCDRRLDLEQRAWAIHAFDGFKRWSKEYLANVDQLQCEVPLVSERWCFRGIADCIATLQCGRVVLIDWKTAREVSPSYLGQLAGYRQAYREMWGRDVSEAWLVRLCKDQGTFEHRPVSQAQLDLAWTFFQSCLVAHCAYEDLKKISSLQSREIAGRPR